MTEKLDIEIQKNLKAFQARVNELAKTDRGRYALLRHEEIVGIYDTVRDAHMTGEKFFEDRLYSIQKIDPTPINLGYFSYAMRVAEPQ